MTVSLIIPVYNTAGYLSECLDSVRNQSYHDFEAILIDDGSTDESGSICDKYAKEDSRFHIIHKENEGVSVARNVGLEVAQGHYILFVDSDDILDDDMLNKLVGAICAQGADMAVCNIIELRDSIVKRKAVNKGVLTTRNAFNYIVSNSVTLWNKLIKKEIIGDIRFNPVYSYGEDTLFICEVMTNCKKIVCIEDYLYKYRIEREGNVVSAPLNNRDLDLLRTNLIVYKDYCIPEKQYSAGVQRMYCAIATVLRKLSYSVANNISLNNKPYIDELKKIASCVRWNKMPNIESYVKLGLIKTCSVSPWLTKMIIH